MQSCPAIRGYDVDRWTTNDSAMLSYAGKGSWPTDSEALVNHSDEFERTSLCFRADQLQRLRTISKGTGVPIAFMVRQGVDHYLDGHR